MMATNEQAIASLENSVTMLDLSLSPLLQLAESQKTVFNQGSAGWLKELRVQGAYRVSHSVFPTKRDEDWRVTDISILRQTKFVAPQQFSVSAAEIEAACFPEAPHRLVFINGQFSAELSETNNLPDGLFVGNLSQLSTEQGAALVQSLGSLSRDLDVFAALNNAGFHDGAIIWAQKNVVLDAPIEVVFMQQAETQPIATQSRCLAIAEAGASLNLIEYYGAATLGCSDQDAQLYFNNVLTEVLVKPNAQVTHVRVQREAGAGIQIANTAVAQSADSTYRLTEVNMGAQLSRHTLTINQEGANTQTYLNGLTMVGAEQVSDTHSAVNLKHPYGVVDQLHKCIIDGAARSIFNGKIDVPQNAQMTNAAQLNRNLLLSPKARIDTKPELQITADNVKCAHGATVSQLENDEIFYLRSRGLNEYDARHLLIDAFAAEIIDTINIASLRERLTGCVACRTID